MTGQETFNFIAGILDKEKTSITSREFYKKFCVESELSNKDYERIVKFLEEVFPSNSGGWAAGTDSELGAVVNILPQSPEFEKEMLFGHASIDHFGNICLIPDCGYKLMFLASENKIKVRDIISGLSDYSAEQKYQYYQYRLKPLLKVPLEISWATNVDLNFTLKYPERFIEESNVTGICFDTRLTDNRIYLLSDV